MTQFDVFRKQKVFKSFQRKSVQKFSAEKTEIQPAFDALWSASSMKWKVGETEVWEKQCNTIVGAILLWVKYYCVYNNIVGTIILWV